MHPDYIHNPPNMSPMIQQSYYLILFVNNKNIQMKGKATIYRRKTFDMLCDLIEDLDEIYFHSDETDPDKQYLIEQTQTIDCYFKIKYTADFNQVLRLINPNGYIIHYSWNDIPNCNPMPPPPPPQPYYPPYPHQYKITQVMYDTNQIIQRFGDEQ